MAEPRRSRSLHLSVWLGTILAGTLLVIVAPVGWIAKEALEARLVEQETEQTALVHEDWRSHIDERLVETEASVTRLGRLLTLALAAPRNAGDDAEFDKLVEKTQDGCLKSRKDLFDHRKHAGIWVPPSYPLEGAERTLFLTAKRMFEVYQTGTAADFMDTWMLPVRGGEVIYWPDAPNFLPDLTASTDYTQTEWVTLVTPEKDPGARAKWTPTIYDPVAKLWMVSAIAPFFRDGKFGGSVGHDITIESFAKTISKIALFEGTHTHFIRNDGTLLVSSARQAAITESNGTLTVDKAGDPSLVKALRALEEKKPNRMVTLPDIDADHVFWGAYLAGPEWYVVSSVPRSSILKSVQASNRTRLLIVLVGLLSVLVVPVLVMSRLLLPPLRRLATSVLLIRAGDSSVRFGQERVLELDHVASALNAMIGELAASAESREKAMAALSASEQKTREMLEERTRDELELRKQLEVIQEQQKTIHALSTPIIEVWEDVLALPVIGRLTEARAEQATGVLLDAIVRTGARVAILDLTGVDQVDQATAGHLLALVQAVRLVGAEVIVTGLRAEIARSLIALDVDLSAITTKSTLREAIRVSRKSTKAKAFGGST